MAKKADRINVGFLCSNCNTQNYVSNLNKKTTGKKELKKYCPKCNGHYVHKSREKLK